MADLGLQRVPLTSESLEKSVIGNMEASMDEYNQRHTGQVKHVRKNGVRKEVGEQVYGHVGFIHP